MSQHVTAIQKAIKQLVDERREMVVALANTEQAEGAEGLRVQFVTVQSTIEALGRALQEERKTGYGAL
ncbi:MAG: hypothetical protein HXX10_20830 [Rhodoplanes sp.]|uniref:hypothetical protein n=1 Tax=Rhodoplanes sp. TaxID=1968906 RepID=UPI0017E2D513|nr:hypothetical protein [Rhodoplanes sp.]NVO16480.1 hypothetical protein [Rhodoplanes sp.]